jgi:hypothetical protein
VILEGRAHVKNWRQDSSELPDGRIGSQGKREGNIERWSFFPV